MKVRKMVTSPTRWLLAPVVAFGVLASAMMPGAAMAEDAVSEEDATLPAPAEEQREEGLSGPTSDAATELAACENVHLRVTNNKSVKIKALKVEYKSVEDGKWRNEQFPNTTVRPGQTKSVKRFAKLEHVEGHRMQAIRLHYKVRCGGKWSKTRTTTDTTFDGGRKCVFGKNYRIDTPGGGC